MLEKQWDKRHASGEQLDTSNIGKLSILAVGCYKQ